MNTNTEKRNEQAALIDQAVAGDKAALETLLTDVQDLVFSLSLRMLGTIPDAEDAAQEIMIKVMTHLSSFRRESAFSTWVFRIASNHLRDYKKGMFAAHPLSFEYYGFDIANGKTDDIADLSRGVDRALLEQELKLSCTNVMLQCLDAESRCIFILGTMFKLDSRIAGEILDMTPEAYRQRLSRIRKKVAAFLDEYCGLSGKGQCSCKKRVDYAIQSHRMNPDALEYSGLETDEEFMKSFVSAMDEIDDLSLVFASLPSYRATANARRFLTDFLSSERCSFIMNA